MFKYSLVLFTALLFSQITLASDDTWIDEYSSPEAYSEEAAYVANWCKSTSRILRNELSRAKEHLAYSELKESKAVLVSALKKASASYKDTRKAKPMTKKLLERATRYLDVIQKLEWPAPERLKLISQLHFLVEYTELIIETEKNLDTPYHIPYHYHHGSCRHSCHFDVASYEAAFVQHMRSELNFVVDRFTFYGSNNNYGPIGTPEIYLKISQILANGVATDLSENLYRYQNACSVRNLRRLSVALKKYNYEGDRTEFRSEPVAVDRTTERLLKIAGNLRPQDNHNYTHHDTHEGTVHHGNYGCGH